MWLVYLYFISSTMPKFHINGLSTYHNSSQKMNDFEINNVTSSSLMVTERSQNSTTATSNPDTIDSGNSFSGNVILIIFFCSALAIIIAIGILLARKRRVTNTRESQESNVAIEMEPLSLINAMQNWTNKPRRWLLPHFDKMQFLRIYDGMDFCVWQWILFLILSFSLKQNLTESIGRLLNLT